MEKPTYTIMRAAQTPSLDTTLGVPAKGWDKAETGTLTRWHRASGPIRPTTFFRAMYDARNLYVRFDVLDTFVKVVHTHRNDNVCEDSCVEFFVQPAPGTTYFNFEINGGGTMLLYKMIDATKVKRDGKTTFREFEVVPAEWAEQVEIHHTLPQKVARPIEQPIAWSVAYRIPLALFTACLGKCSVAKGDVWRGNFFKCGGSCHYGMWSDVGRPLNFHQPAKFGELVFG